MRSRPWARSQVAAASSSGGRMSGASSNSRKPNMPQRLSWNALKLSSYWALMRPTTRPSRQARKSCASPCVKNAFCERIRKRWRSRRSGGTQTPEVECSRYGSSTNSRRSRQPETGRTTTLTETDPTNADCHRRLRQGARARALRAAARRPRGGPAALLPPPRGPGRAGGGDGGRRADHARLQQLPRADGRPARARRPPATRSTSTAPA